MKFFVFLVFSFEPTTPVRPAESRPGAAPGMRGECTPGLRNCLKHARHGPTCEGAGPCDAEPISTYLRSPGLPRLTPPGSPGVAGLKEAPRA
jgi:hypothetical protein